MQIAPEYGASSRSMTRTQQFERLQTSEHGLTSQEAKKRLSSAGFNEPATIKQGTSIPQLLRLFLNPLVLILLIASLVTAFLGDVINASIIITMVLLGIGLNFAQTYRSQRAVEQLRADVAPIATVLRDATWQTLPRRLLVPGDIIRLAAGDLVPADALLLEATDLHMQQAALTGESIPVEKSAREEQSALQNLADDPGLVFLGTSVVSGTGLAVVTATGRNTSFGDIVVRLAQRPPETEFERGIRSFSFLILQTVVFLILSVFLIGVVFHHPLFESMLFAIALAVGLTPEFLPMITTVTLGQGALRMAKQKVIVKHLESMQNFGSIDVLCSDKTGTLTSGSMALSAYLDLQESPSERVLLLAYLNSTFESGIQSPLDAAILNHTTLDVNDYKKLDELPFDFERRRLSVVVQRQDEVTLITKGAPESVLPVCTSYEIAGEQKLFDAEARACITNKNMFLTVYTSFKCNFSVFACKIAFETSIKIWDEPLFKMHFVGIARKMQKSKSIGNSFPQSPTSTSHLADVSVIDQSTQLFCTAIVRLALQAEY